MNTTKNYKTIPLIWAVIIALIIAVAAAVIIYVQYDQHQKYIAANEDMIKANENQVLSAFERIEANLASIREKESLIRQDLTSPENYGNQGPEERIQHEIEFIQHLMDENNALISDLYQRIEEKDSRLTKYEGTLRDYKTRISQYQSDLDKLFAENKSLQVSLEETTMAKNMLTAKVDTLNEDIAQKAVEIENQKLKVIERDNALNTAYYAIGPYKELRDKNIIQKEGGFLGINRVKTLTGNPDPTLFQQVDIREIRKIPVFAKSWEIVSGQDPSSYEKEYINENLEWITITDPEKFWKKSKYLVIVIREKNADDLAFSR